MKVSELTGAQLDYWVAKAEGHEWRCVWMLEQQGLIAWQAYEHAWGNPTPAYSTDWSAGGPLIEKYKITSGREHDGGWFAEIDGYPSDSSYGDGDTLLQAVCRCIVRDKYHTDVPGIRESAGHLSAQS